MGWISRQAAGHIEGFILRQCVDYVRHLNGQIDEAERKIAVEANKSENVHLLMSLTGAGLLWRAAVGHGDRGLEQVL